MQIDTAIVVLRSAKDTLPSRSEWRLYSDLGLDLPSELDFFGESEPLGLAGFDSLDFDSLDFDSLDFDSPDCDSPDLDSLDFDSPADLSALAPFL